MTIQKSTKFNASVFKSVSVDRIFRGYQRFSDDTNITGFKELYYAKSFVFKFVWFSLILFGICFTTYQCCYTIMEYVNEPTNTVVQQLRSDPVYPPLKLCFAHWIFWVDWQKFLNQNLNLYMDRSTFLYSMSYAKTVFMDQPVDNFTVAKEMFEKMISNYKNLSDYYLSISRDLPWGIKNADKYGYLTKQFHDYFGSEFCYVWPAESVNNSSGDPTRTTSKKSGGPSWKLNIDFHYDIQIGYVSELEVNYYRRAAFAYESSNSSNLTLLGNETEIYVSPMIYADGTNDQVIPDANYFQYILRLKANVYKWKSTSDRPCTNDYGVDFGGKLLRNCLKRCQVMAQFNNSATVCTPFRNADYVNHAGKICRQDFVLAVPNTNEKTETKTVFPGDPFPSDDDNYVSDDYSKCVEQCIRPCDQWIYETSTVTNLRPYQFRSSLPSTTDVEIQYPSADTIVVMQEIPSQTWQKMLSDVGGLLGLWMGATIFSFFQIIFLCCCGEADEICSSRKLNKITTDESPRSNKVFQVETNHLNFIRSK